MLTEFRMPALGADMETGTVVQWNVAPGATVKRGDVVAVVETDKGAIDVEIFLDGVVRQLVVEIGTKVPVGTVLALVEEAGARLGAIAPAQVGTAHGPAAITAATVPIAPVDVGAAPAAAAATPAIVPVTSAAATQPQRARSAVSPSARVLAHELGVDVDTLRGTGAGGAITRADVERAARPPAPRTAPQPATPTAAAGSAMRDAIAAAMSKSKREIPHYYLSLASDVTPAMDWLTARNATVPVTERLLFAALLVKSLALACRALPGFSGFHRGGRYEPSPAVHVGVAVAIRGGGLVAPAITDTADKSLAAVMDDFRGLVTRARAGRLRASELAAPTIVLTSLGEASVDAVFPIIQPPQVAIVGAGAPAMRPWVVDGAVTARQVLTLSLGADHRVTDGRLGAQFLARIAELLSRPDRL